MEDSAWSRTVKLRTKDVNLFRRLRTSRLLEMLQEASIAHTEELGWTRETTLDRGFLWVVAMQQLQVIRMPEYDETVTLRSWPGPMMHVLYPRQYLLEDEEGNALVRGSAIWTLVDTETRAMADPDAHGVVIEGARTGLDYPLPGLVHDEDCDRTSSFTAPSFSRGRQRAASCPSSPFSTWRRSAWARPSTCSGARMRSLHTWWASKAGSAASVSVWSTARARIQS